MKLFEPMRIKKLELKNRIVMSAHGSGYATREGDITPRHIYYHARRDKGIGLDILEISAVGPRYVPNQPNLSEDRFVPGFKKLVNEVHKHDTVFLMQLQHPGRETHPIIADGYPPVGPSASPRFWLSPHRKPFAYYPHKEVPDEEYKALSPEGIEEVIEMFAKAAGRAQEAGADGIEIHAAHGYLISQFLSPAVNKRTDEYGGDVKGRAKLCVDIIRRIRQTTGEDFIISCRINGADYIEGGSTVEDAKVFAPLLVEAGADIIHVSGGFYGSMPASIVPMGEPDGVFVPAAEAIKSVVNVPVIAAGRIYDPRFAEDILQKNKADLVTMTRALIADPDMPQKAREGRFDDIRKCIHCNQGCVTRLYSVFFMKDKWQSGSSCLVNPEVGREEQLEQGKLYAATSRPKKVLVVGGGPAGLKAAETAALRGHQVTLCEKERVLGGRLLMAAKVPTQGEFVEAIQHIEKQLRKMNVKIERREVTPEVVDELNPDVAIVSTGGLPLIPEIPGIESGKLFTADQVFESDVDIGKKVLIIGGDYISGQVACFLAYRGKVVTIVEASSHWFEPPPLYGVNRFYLRTMLSMNEVDMRKGTSVVGVSGNEVTVRCNGREEVVTVDAIVLTKFKANHQLAEAIESKVSEVYIIGDASEPRLSLEAFWEGFDVGDRI